MEKTGRIVGKLAVLLVYYALVTYLCLGSLDYVSQINVPHYIFGIRIDRWVHFLMFFPMPLLLYWIAPKRRRFLSLSVSALISLAVSATLEYLQRFTPTRFTDPKDLRANWLAVIVMTTLIAIGMLIWMIVAGKIC
ncbi:MAG: VanZ family protein [Bacteroidales bacterium]|nr:VanZ family protein [Candidatus Equibacterium intestinale]